MPTDKENDNRAYFWFDPWRYCNYNQAYQGDKPKRSKYVSDDTTSVSYINYGSIAVDDGDESDEVPKPDDGAPMDIGPDERGAKEDAPMEKGKNEKKDRQAKARPEPGVRPAKQKHVHEFEGSTKLADFDEDVHNHRVAGITGEAIYRPGGHVHKIWTRTDFFDHFHYIQELSGPAIYVGKDDGVEDADLSEQPHVHFVSGLTTINDKHSHEFQFATLIDSPLLPEEEKA